MLVVVAIYARTWGWANFLWFSDIALILSAPALWLESPLLASMMALAVLIPDGIWIVSWVGQLVTGRRVIGLADYMFDATKPRWLRAISLFHLWLPLLLAAMVLELGYDPRALVAMTVLCWIVCLVCFFFTRREDNINWVFGFAGRPQSRWPDGVQLLLTMAAFPIVVYVPTHFLLRAWAG